MGAPGCLTAGEKTLRFLIYIFAVLCLSSSLITRDVSFLSHLNCWLLLGTLSGCQRWIYLSCLKLCHTIVMFRGWFSFFHICQYYNNIQRINDYLVYMRLKAKSVKAQELENSNKNLIRFIRYAFHESKQIYLQIVFSLFHISHERRWCYLNVVYD